MNNKNKMKRKKKTMTSTKTFPNDQMISQIFRHQNQQILMSIMQMQQKKQKYQTKQW